MKKPAPEPAAGEINAKTEDLIREFMEHVRQVHAEYPEEHDRRKIFESWAIQKIAALQYTVLQLADELIELREHLRTKK